MELLVELDNTGYRDELFNNLKLLKLFNKTKFNLVISHVIIDALDNYKELTKEEILDVNVKKTKRPPLQKNTIYCYCKLRRYAIDCDILQKLIKYPSQPNEIKIIINELSYYEDSYNVIDIPIYKDLKFEYGDKEVGWYNKENNILWISDIGHFPDRIIKNFEFILSNIIEFNRNGSVAVLPNLIIGCDLEFELSDKNGHFIPASKYIDDIQDRNHRIGNEIGLDGHSNTGEIRPPSANNPIKLSRNIKRTVKKLVHKLSLQNPDLQIFCGGGLTENLGGHIHFNIENFNINDIKLKHILYDLMGAYLKKGMIKRSPRIEMNQYMDRDANDGFRTTECHPGMEWRFPPSFMLNETICKAILCTTWCIIKEYYGYGFPNIEYTQAEVIKTLTSLHLYSYYKIWIDQFIDIFILHKTAMEGKDIKNEWGIKTHPCNILIFSTIAWINEYFSSTKINISNTIKISIQKDNKGRLVIYTISKLPAQLASEIMIFADNHLVPLTINVQTDLEHDIMIWIPWETPPNLKMAFDKLKVILKKIIIEIDKDKIEKLPRKLTTDERIDRVLDDI